MTYNYLIAGVGGQGTVLASKLIATAAMKKGFDVRTTETIGMAQRGGCVFGHVRIGEKIFSPLVPQGKANALIAFEPAEGVRQLSYLRKDGTVIVCNNPIKPITLSVSGNYEVSVMMDYLKTKTENNKTADMKKLLDPQTGSSLNNIQTAANSADAEHSIYTTGNMAKTLNVFILGAAAQNGIFPFDADTLMNILKDVLPERVLGMNLKAFELGRQLHS